MIIAVVILLAILGVCFFKLLVSRRKRKKLQVQVQALRKKVKEKEQLEQSLRENEERLCSLFENAAVGIVVRHLPEGILTFNPVLREMLGYDEDEVDHLPAAYVHPEDRETFEHQLSRLKDGTIESVRINQRFIRKDGSMFWGHATLVLIRDDRKHPKYLVGTVEDITKQEKRSQEVHQRNQELESLLAMSQRLNLELDLDELLNHILQSVEQLVPQAEAPSLWFYNAKTDEIRFQAWHGHDIEVTPRRVVVGNSFLGQVLQEQKPKVFNNPQDLIESSPSIAPLVQETKTVVGVPLLWQNKSIGILLAGNTTEGTVFNDHTVRLLTSLAAQASMGIHNAQLIQHVRAMSFQLLYAEEEERRRIATELHDEIGGLLTMLKMQLRRETNSNAVDHVNRLIKRVRHITLDLRPAVLDDLGLVAALEEYIERYTDQTGVYVEFQTDITSTHRFDSNIEVTLYRMVQEALTNVARHAEIKRAQVLLHRDPGQLTVHVIDEGVGFAKERVLQDTATHGLSGMKERAQLIGGTVKIDAAPGAGTHITVALEV